MCLTFLLGPITGIEKNTLDDKFYLELILGNRDIKLT